MAVGKYLADIAMDLIEEQGGESAHLLKKYISFGIKGIRQIHMKYAGAPTYKLIELNENLPTIEIPDDCIRVIGLSEINPDNTLKPLKIKDDIVLNDDSSKGYGNRAYTGLFSHQYSDSMLRGAAYKINPNTSTLKVSSEITSDCLWLEYLADVKKIDGQYLVHYYDEEAVLAYMYYLSIRNNPNYSPSERREAERRWDREMQSSRRMNKSQPIADMISEFRKTQTGTVSG